MAMTTASRKHQAACEDAGGLSCDCGCGGPGHRKAILERCLRAAGPADSSFTSVANHLEDIYGVFHTDPSTEQRRYHGSVNPFWPRGDCLMWPRLRVSGGAIFCWRRAGVGRPGAG